MIRHAARTLSKLYFAPSSSHAKVQLASTLPRMGFSTETKSGVMGSLRSAYDTAVTSREEQSKDKIFAIQMKFLASKTPVTPQIFLQLLEEVKVQAGFGGMKKHLPWVANNEAVKDFEQQESIIKALTPAERTSSRSQRISTKKRIARAADCDLGTVESVLSQISSMYLIQKRVLGRIDRGEQVPKSSEELKLMMASSGSGGRVQMPKSGVKHKGSQRTW